VDAALPPGIRAGNASTNLLPSTHLTPRTLFGAGGDARETFGQLVAAQIGSLLALRNADDPRTLVVGLGLEPQQSVGEAAQAAYFDVVELVQKAL
jgi:proteasome assembly chaperone 3